MNIVLTGLRGSGKSQLGKILADKLNFQFIDLDKEIEQHENTKIKTIVELRGWEYFRAVESEITKKISLLDKTVIATGGGTIIDRDNEKALKKTGKIIYLFRKPEDCIKYIEKDPNRPPLSDKETITEEMEQLYKERNGRYCESAHIVFERSENLETDAQTIIEKLHGST